MEDFVTFECAKKLKEKGFNNECHAYYEPIKHCLNISRVFKTNTLAENYNCITAPTISQVLKWLRDKFFLHISQKPYPCENGLMWMYEIRKFNKYIVFVIANKTGFIKEEQATLAGIEYVLDNLI